jgi:hypothetical protein
MKIKIIKRAERQKFKEKIAPTDSWQPKNETGRSTASTIKFWIDDLRQKRKQERLSIEELFRKERCT